jgi:signal transduction histidine kinase
MPRKSSTPLALHEVIRILAAEHAYLFLGSDANERVVLRSAQDKDGRELGHAGHSPEVVERVRLSREPLAASGTDDGAGSLDGVPLPPRHLLAAPLLLGHRLFGVIYLDRGLTRGRFTDDDVEILVAIADHLALALETAHTEQLESERSALARSKQAAIEASRAKSTFIAHMSHELRTPLTAIIGYSELLEEEFLDRNDATHVPDVQRIQTAAKHLLSLINNMLDVSKIEAGKMELFLEEFDLAEVVAEAVQQASPLVERGDNTFVYSGPPALGVVRLDRTKVRQVLLNLLSNAGKFTAGGRVELAVAREVRAREEVVLRVTDTGIGMSPEQIKRIFQEFAQGSAATTRRYGGTGLGLAITRNFCQLMRGDIEVDSSLGRGSTFTVRLPAELSEDELGGAAAGSEGEPGDDEALRLADEEEGGGPRDSGRWLA